jgi:hypothetical protein
MPADAPFHFPDPALPLSWPLAYAPLIETRTRPSRPTLPDTSAPGAEIFPSATVSVELVVGSQLPVLVMTVTFHSPSKGDWAFAGAEAMRLQETSKAPKKAKRMRWSRMNWTSPMWLGRRGLFRSNMSKICRIASIGNVCFFSDA